MSRIVSWNLPREPTGSPIGLSTQQWNPEDRRKGSPWQIAASREMPLTQARHREAAFGRPVVVSMEAGGARISKAISKNVRLERKLKGSLEPAIGPKISCRE